MIWISEGTVDLPEVEGIRTHDVDLGMAESDAV